MNNRRNSELLEAFKLFDTDGDGKVMIGYNTFIRLNIIIELSFEIYILIGTLN